MFNLSRSGRKAVTRPALRVALYLEGFESRVVPSTLAPPIQHPSMGTYATFPVAAPPQITTFYAEWIDTGVYELFGTVTAGNPAGMVVTFGGSVESISGLTTTVNADGTFKIRVTIGPNESGTISAITTDSNGVSSNLAITFIFPN